MHRWIRNPKAPSSLWDGLVLDGAYAGLHPHTNRFVDGSGLENHGVLTNMDAVSDWVWSDELGRWVTEFGAAGEAIRTGTRFDRLTRRGPYSICGWIRPSAISGVAFRGVWTDAIANSNYPTVITVIVTATPVWGAYHARSDWTFATVTGRTPVVGQWQHISQTWDGATLRLYVDGVSVGSPVSESTIRPDDRNGGVFRLGQYTDAGQFLGTMSDHLTASRALAPEEITWLADRSNRLYTPDTRRHFWFPMSRPWLYARTSSVIIGGGIA